MWLHLLARTQTNTSKVQKIVFFPLGNYYTFGNFLVTMQGTFLRRGNFTVANHISALVSFFTAVRFTLSEKMGKITLENGVGQFETDLGSKCVGKFIFVICLSSLADFNR